MDNRTEARIAALEAQISNLKRLLPSEADESQETSSRRGMVKLMAVTAVGAVTGAAMLGARPAAALQNEPVVAGLSNDFASATGLHATDDSALICNSDANFGIEANGAVANALFQPTGDPPLGTAGTAGALFVDTNGDWWASTFSDLNDGLWRKLASSDSAGQLHLLPAPVRVYDSRPGEAPATVGPKSPTESNVQRTIDTTLGGISGVPTTANAVLISLTIAGPQGQGFGAVWPSGNFPGTSNINFVAGQNIAATAIVGCGAAATIQVMSNAVTDFIVDVSGYYQ
jgi:hypothetical protein